MEVAESQPSVDDYSDSGISVGGRDERSGSRSSALSDERGATTPTTTTKVWRDPTLVNSKQATIRHVNSVQHSGIMSNPPITSPHHLYPSTPYSPSPHPMVHALYPTLGLPQYPPGPHGMPHNPRHYMIPHGATDAVLLERERMVLQQQMREQEREREKERERQKEREKEERDRLLHKEKTEQAVQQHFDESFRLHAKKAGWPGLPPNASNCNVSPGSAKTVNPPASLTAAQRQHDTEKWVMAHHPQFSPHEVTRPPSKSLPGKMEPAQNLVKTTGSSSSSNSVLALPKAELSVPSITGLYGYQPSSYPPQQSPYHAQEKRHSPKPQTQASRASPFHHYVGPVPGHPHPHMKMDTHSPKNAVVTKPPVNSVPSPAPPNQYSRIHNPVPTYRHSPSPSHPGSSVIMNRPKVGSPVPKQVFGKPPALEVPLNKNEMIPSPLPLTSKPSTPAGLPPPPAHSSRPVSAPGGYGGTAGPPPVGLPLTSGSPMYQTQTQPLDLGARSDNDSPKRKSSVEDLMNKRPKVSEVSTTGEAVLGRVSEPSPLVSGAAATITSVVNTAVSTATTSPERPDRPRSTASVTSSSSYPVHNFKKAWLKRHANEDSNDGMGSDNSRTTSIVTPVVTVNSSSNISGSVVRPFQSVTASVTSANSTSGNSSASSVTTTAAVSPVKTTTTTSTSPSSTTGTKELTKELIKIRRPPKGKTTTQVPINGHKNSENTEESSSSSESDSRSSKKKAKKKGSKVKETNKKPRTQSESQSESEKESGPDESEDQKQRKGAVTKKEETRKRPGRKPKEEKGGKKPREASPDPLKKPPVSTLKKTGESFFQDGPCYTIAKNNLNVYKCRECRWTQLQRTRKKPDIFCRFYAFRRLKYHRNGQLATAGFSDPLKDASKEDIKLWLPQPDDSPKDLSEDEALNLLTYIGDHFCDLVEQEKYAIAMHMGENKTVAWKRAVNGVREMCDVCETTLFNIHWTCGRCGFVVCIDCYRARKEGTIKWREKDKEKDGTGWLLCTNRQPHEQESLMLTQIVAGDALIQVSAMIHQVRRERNISQYCGCKLAGPIPSSPPTNGISKELLKVVKQEKKDTFNGEGEKSDGTEADSPLSWLADVALSSQKAGDCSSGSDSEDGEKSDQRHSTLRELLIRKGGSSGNGSGSTNSNNARSISTLDDVISCVMDQSQSGDSTSKDDKDKLSADVELKHFIRKNGGHRIKGREPLPIRIMTKTESSNLYPKVPHSWLCDGKLLRLQDPRSKHNTGIFQEHWKRGQPVIASETGKYLTRDLWTPDSISKEYGEERIDLINCLNNKIVPNQPMKKFWDGFEQVSKVLKDEKGMPMLLKVKDWPPTEDFADLLPTRFMDLMSGLPVPEYTRRDGTRNLASRLPDCFVRPDLGPKMYIAYGSCSYPKKATTNLHLDISDAANVMVYVGIPKDKDAEEQMKGCLRALDEAGCDILTRRRVREKGEKVGALWHIYHPRDADKIRDLLNKVAIEKGARLEQHHDPIHDQSWYLDGPLRERLYKEYGVDGYAIAQCEGDSVFVPAGAPHQVRNLNNCIKVAEDFVSPENVGYCFHLTQEFRQLSDTHSNHEDKLQIKNIIYHSVKDVMSVLLKT